MTGTFNTTANAQEVKPGQPLAPITITVNDRAATREAIIRKGVLPHFHGRFEKG
ncbi:hypothetical protein ACMHYQ_24780 [Ectopseudomonas guguanensis]|uniref:hypothetical protein n=1 Tax=Ectopseudomonas guguanensis TaxID=1198456 RepID=UPI0039C13CE5